MRIVEVHSLNSVAKLCVEASASELFGVNIQYVHDDFLRFCFELAMNEASTTSSQVGIHNFGILLNTRRYKGPNVVAYLLAFFDTAENESSKICQQLDN